MVFYKTRNSVVENVSPHQFNLISLNRVSDIIEVIMLDIHSIITCKDNEKNDCLGYSRKYMLFF